jgi:hypothetical protein
MISIFDIAVERNNKEITITFDLFFNFFPTCSQNNFIYSILPIIYDGLKVSANLMRILA